VSPHVTDTGVFLPNLNRTTSSDLLFFQPSETDLELYELIRFNNHPIIIYEQDLIMGWIFSRPFDLNGRAVGYVRLSGAALRETLENLAAPNNMAVYLFAGGESVQRAGIEVGGNDNEYIILRSAVPQWDLELAAFLPVSSINNAVIPAMVATIIIFTAILIISVIIFSIYTNRSMIKPLDTAMKEAYDKNLAAEKAKLKQLQSQINPHFLYNSFYQIYRLSKMGDMELVPEISLKLSRYYQYITRDRDDTVPLHVEVKHAQNYADIQTIRFGNRIECVFDEVPDEYRLLNVPKICLQPILENAYTHGLEDRVDDARINISFRCVDGSLCLSIEDNGDSLTDENLLRLQEKLNRCEESSETTGLLNIKQRFIYLYKENADMNVTRGRSGGLRCEIKINITGD